MQLSKNTLLLLFMSSASVMCTQDFDAAQFSPKPSCQATPQEPPRLETGKLKDVQIYTQARRAARQQHKSKQQKQKTTSGASSHVHPSVLWRPQDQARQERAIHMFRKGRLRTTDKRLLRKVQEVQRERCTPEKVAEKAYDSYLESKDCRKQQLQELEERINGSVLVPGSQFYAADPDALLNCYPSTTQVVYGKKKMEIEVFVLWTIFEEEKDN